MNIDRSREFETPNEPPHGRTGNRASRMWQGFSHWSGRHPRLARTLWFAVGLALLALLIWAIYPKPQARLRFNQGPQAVSVAVAQNSDIDVTLNALGTVTPMATATVRPQVGGMLVRLNFTEGQMVKAGDVLAEIDPRPYQAELDQARGQLARDSATLANAKVDLQRYQALQKQNAISQQQVATQAAQVKSYQGVVVADQANVETARINLGYTKVVSPITGRAGLHLIDIGNIVSAGQSTGIVVVTQLQPMSVLFTIPEDEVHSVMTHMRNATKSDDAKLQVDVFDRTQVKKIATGTLATVDNVVDPATGTVKLRAMFDNKDFELFPAQFVNVRLLVNTLHHQTVVPVAAIQRGSGGSYVFIVTPAKTVFQRAVTTGVQDGDRIQILKGLKPGDTVVVDGADRLRDGADISIPGQDVKIAAPSMTPGDAARAAARAKREAALEEACSGDVAKLCPAAKGDPRQMRTCLNEHRSQLGKQCSQAREQMRRGAARP